MVKSLSIFALYSPAIAVPALEPSESEAVGFWEKWVEDIEANPDTAPSPEDAWGALNATIHENQSSHLWTFWFCN